MSEIEGLIYLDTETTGTSFLKTNVIQVAMILETPDFEFIDKLALNINIPRDSEWTEGAEDVHKISKSVAMNHGVNQKDAICKINEFLYSKMGDVVSSARVVGANSYFDHVLIQNMYEKNNYNRAPWSYRLFDINQIGSMLGVGSRLYEVLKNLGVEIDQSKTHDALYDAELHRSAFHGLSALATKKGLTLF
jgi:DNA polymerase III alpha subunit (gram-positive type)